MGQFTRNAFVSILNHYTFLGYFPIYFHYIPSFAMHQIFVQDSLILFVTLSKTTDPTAASKADNGSSSK